MSVENARKFYEAVSQDKEMQRKFSDLSRKYRGEPMDEKQLKALVNEEIVPMADQMGFRFTADDLKQFEKEMYQPAADKEMSEAEMQAVSGGNAGSYCFIAGYNVDEDEWSPKTVAKFCIWFGV